MKRTDVRDFFIDYGVVEASCMCLGVACGVPFDAGVGTGVAAGGGGGGGGESDVTNR